MLVEIDANDEIRGSGKVDLELKQRDYAIPRLARECLPSYFPDLLTQFSRHSPYEISTISLRIHTSTLLHSYISSRGPLFPGFVLFRQVMLMRH
jgi:hypothetical protein